MDSEQWIVVSSQKRVALRARKKSKDTEIVNIYGYDKMRPSPDPVHYYTHIGTEAFANQVLSYLLPALKVEEELAYKEELHTDKPVGI